MSRQRFSTAPEGGKRVEFDFTFWTDRDHGTDYAFGAIPVVDQVQIARINKLAARKGGEGILELIESVQSAIRRMLDDSDGTPTDWFPTGSPDVQDTEPDGELWPHSEAGELVFDESSDLNEDDAETTFIAPDGSFVPYSKVADYTSLEAASSLRRWNMLMDDARDMTVPAEQLLGAWRWLTAQAGKGRSGK